MHRNIDYWEISSTSFEPPIDRYYLVNITPTQIQLNNIFILRSAIRTACESKEYENNKLIEEILNILKLDGVQYTEFVAFLNAFDLTLHILETYSLKDQISILKIVLKEYCETRFTPLYSSLDDNNKCVIQALIDKSASRRKGEVGKEKIKNLLKEKFNAEEVTNPFEFFNQSIGEITYLDVNHYEKAFNDIKRRLELRKKFDKNPDLLVRIKNHVFIIEAKHIKESGGAQDKQLLELCNFINFQEEGKDYQIHYISFLDGVMANEFFTGGHHYSQRALSELKNNPSNYFVNTVGFIRLMEDLLESKDKPM